MEKSPPVLHINNFVRTPTHQPEFYIRLFEEHVVHHPFVQTAHRHDFYFIVAFTKGSGTHTIDFVSYEVKPGSVFLMSPAQIHSWQLSTDTTGYVLFFSSEFYLLDFNQKKLFDFPFFHTLTNEPCIYVEESVFEQIEALFKSIYEESIQETYRKAEVIRSYLDILLIKLTGIYRITIEPKVSPHLAYQVRKLEELVEVNYLHHKSVSDYADLMFVSGKQLNAICQAALGKSVSEVIRERLMLEAKRLLVHTQLSVAQIAAKLNYLDNSYFNRFFKKVVKMTPEQFRRTYQ